MESIKLSDGNQIPTLGLGTWQISADDCDQVIKLAIYLGYRHFDLAYIYLNEEEIGKAIRDAIGNGTVTRDQLFLTGKSWSNYRTKERVVEGCKKSLNLLGLDYFDLYLVHFPVSLQQNDKNPLPTDSNGQLIIDDTIDYLETWQGMEVISKTGLAKSIGVSNFNIDQLTRLVSNCQIKPVVHQIECHPYLNQSALIDHAEKLQMKTTSFSPLASPTRNPLLMTAEVPQLLDNGVLVEIAKNHNRSPAQVSIRYQIQRGIAVIPKSQNGGRLKENSRVMDFILSEEEMKQIDSLDINGRVFVAAGFKPSKYYPF